MALFLVNSELFKDVSTYGARIDIADAKRQTPIDLVQVEECRATTEFLCLFVRHVFSDLIKT